MQILAGLTLLSCVVAASACAPCGDNAAAIERARALTPSQRDSVASELRAFAASHPEASIQFGEESAPPAVLAVLQPQALASGGGTPRLYLSGCVDDKVIVYLSEPSEDAATTAELVLVKGEQGGNEVLWQGAR
jgi:hypothetical protein